MKSIAVVGSGIAGIAAAWWLAREHRVVLYEANDYPGGHVHTVPVRREHGDYEVDTGFIVFNDRTYPLFNRLLAELEIDAQPTAMGFSVHDPEIGLEYCGDGLGGFFAQRHRWLSPTHWKLLRDILRFNREAPAWLDADPEEMRLGDLLEQGGYGEAFRRHYLLPMASAIWSCGERDVEDFPARFFVAFFRNHGLLNLRDRPQWSVVPGGSARYVEALLQRLDADLRLATPVRSVRRSTEAVSVRTDGGEELFDEVVLACHSDQALALLDDADSRETTLLSGIPYKANEVVLHTDVSLLPDNRRVWSSWNARLSPRADNRVEVTYNMNMLQGIDAPETFCVSLNCPDRVAPEKVLGQWRFFHPLFTPDGLACKRELQARNGHNRTWYCGAWMGNGFHEDGVVSAATVARSLGVLE